MPGQKTWLKYGPHHEKTCYAICKQQKRRSACASPQSDQGLCYSLLRQYNTSSFYIQNFKPLASLCSWAGRFESTVVANPEDRFSRDEAHIKHHNDPKFSDRQVWANRVEPDQTAPQGRRSSLINVYTVCHSFCIFWSHNSMVKPPY